MSAFDSKPWLEDLEQARQSFGEKYANFEWLVFDRKVDVSKLFADARAGILNAKSDAVARAVFDHLANETKDGHVELDWPKQSAANAPLKVSTPSHSLCDTLGYDAKKVGKIFGETLPGYASLKDSPSEFPSGLMTVSSTRLAVLRIGAFMPQVSPALCEAALAKQKLAPDAKCTDECVDQIELEASAQMTRDLAAQIRALHKAGAQALMIDLTDNGGGTEWAEAALRMVTPLRVSSERLAFVRGEHWRKEFENQESQLRRCRSRQLAPTPRC